MSKAPRNPDQVALDMATMGTFLAVSCSTYQALNVLEGVADKAKDAVEDAEEIAQDYVDMGRKYGLGGILLGRSDADEKRKLLKAAAWVLRKAPGGALGGLI